MKKIKLFIRGVVRYFGFAVLGSIIFGMFPGTSEVKADGTKVLKETYSNLVLIIPIILELIRWAFRCRNKIFEMVCNLAAYFPVRDTVLEDETFEIDPQPEPPSVCEEKPEAEPEREPEADPDPEPVPHPEEVARAIAAAKLEEEARKREADREYYTYKATELIMPMQILLDEIETSASASVFSKQYQELQEKANELVRYRDTYDVDISQTPIVQFETLTQNMGAAITGLIERSIRKATIHGRIKTDKLYDTLLDFERKFNIKSLMSDENKAIIRTLWDIVNSAKYQERDNIDRTKVYEVNGLFAKRKSELSGNPVMEKSLPSVDAMDGLDFEKWCADLLRKCGYQNVEITKGSGDQGTDIVAEKDGVRYAIQCKCYSSNLDNTPVQEITAGKTLYHCQVGAVMTNRYFTQGAKELAEANGILLWDRDNLQEMLDAVPV